MQSWVYPCVSLCLCTEDRIMPAFTFLVHDNLSGGEKKLKFMQRKKYYDAEPILFDSYRGSFIAGGWCHWV